MTEDAKTSGAGTVSSPREMANAIRALAMDAVQQANSGHPGMPMGMADVATALWTTVLKHNPQVPDWPDRDRFVLSVGHGSMLLYALLYLTGYEDMTIDQIKRFRQLGSICCGHPEYGEAAGIETTTGPLGQGFANAVGMALAETNMAARFGHEIVDHYTYCVVGDGCLMEGISQEAASFAAHHQLGKLITLFDDNGISIDGSTSLSTSEDQAARFRALGWDVYEVDGHDPIKVTEALFQARTTEQPSFIACKTIIAYGAPTKSGTAASHGAPLGEEEIAAAREALEWPYPPFEVPEDILTAWGQSTEPGRDAYEQWAQRFDALDPQSQEEFRRLMSGELPAGWGESLQTLKQAFCAEGKAEATRKSSGAVIKELAEHIPELVGGSADLTGSNLTKTDALTAMTPENRDGRYIYYGIREHAMGAIMNGLILHGGIIPYSGTFLVFSDYMRAPMRLAALMRQGAIYVMTHDSIGVGEDGPTHQPIEHLASLRAIPDLYVFRPADRVETLECWSLAIAHRDRPSVLALTRQNVAQHRLDYTADNPCSRGGYVLRDVPEPQAVVIATGSEVTAAMEAAETLAADKIRVRVVSMPCMELFAQQPKQYQTEVFGSGIPRIGIEAACSMGWERLLGLDGTFIGADRFGTSAPGGEVYQHLGITAEAVVNAVRAQLR